MFRKYFFPDTAKKAEELPTPSSSGSDKVSPSSSLADNMCNAEAINGSPSHRSRQGPPGLHRRFTVGSADDEELMEILPTLMLDKAMQTETKAENSVPKPDSPCHLETFNLMLPMQVHLGGLLSCSACTNRITFSCRTVFRAKATSHLPSRWAQRDVADIHAKHVRNIFP